MTANSTIGRDPNGRDTLKDDIDTLLENSATITDTPSTFSAHQILLSSDLNNKYHFYQKSRLPPFYPSTHPSRFTNKKMASVTLVI